MKKIYLKKLDINKNEDKFKKSSDNNEYKIPENKLLVNAMKIFLNDIEFENETEDEKKFMILNDYFNLLSINGLYEGKCEEDALEKNLDYFINLSKNYSDNYFFQIIITKLYL